MLGYKSVCHDDQSSSDNLDGVCERIIRIIDQYLEVTVFCFQGSLWSSVSIWQTCDTNLPQVRHFCAHTPTYVHMCTLTYIHVLAHIDTDTNFYDINLSDDQGFRLAPLTELGVELPPLPYYLQPKVKKQNNFLDSATKTLKQVLQNPRKQGRLYLEKC